MRRAVVVSAAALLGAALGASLGACRAAAGAGALSGAGTAAETGPAAAAGAAGSDYDRERRALVSTLETARASGAGDPAVARLLLLLSGLTGEVADERAATEFLEAAVRRRPDDATLRILHARLEVRGHRLGAARRILDEAGMAATGVAGPGAGGDGAAAFADEVDAIAADIEGQDGDYAAARARTARLLAGGRPWPALARMAEIEGLTGSAAEADRLYVEAEEDLTAKEMRSWAWLETERGRLDRRRGRPDEAATHYRRAARAYRGYWLVEQRQAELLAERGRDAEAAAAWRLLVAKSPRPEFRQAYGVALRAVGRFEEAEREENAALAAYLDSTRRGETRYYHHLAGYYADVAHDGDEAVRWARRDLEERHGPEAWEELAGACARAGRGPEASAAADRVLAFGLTDPWLVGRATAILASASAARRREP